MNTRRPSIPTLWRSEPYGRRHQLEGRQVSLHIQRTGPPDQQHPYNPCRKVRTSFWTMTMATMYLQPLRATCYMTTHIICGCSAIFRQEHRQVHGLYNGGNGKSEQGKSLSLSNLPVWTLAEWKNVRWWTGTACFLEWKCKSGNPEPDREQKKSGMNKSHVNCQCASVAGNDWAFLF